MYYLQSRYYDPHTGRFLNADRYLYGSILGFNLFAYCENNPVCYIDPTGENGVAALFASWASSAWWITQIDGILPVGDIVFASVLAALGIGTLVEKIIPPKSIVNDVQLSDDNAQEGTSSNNNDENGNPIVEPGELPSKKDGYIPPKKGPRWNNIKKGWEDKNGNVWRPAPTGSKSGHGGGHWDVQSPGGGYTNVYPGGKIRGGKSPLPRLPIFPK